LAYKVRAKASDTEYLKQKLSSNKVPQILKMLNTYLLSERKLVEFKVRHKLQKMIMAIICEGLNWKIHFTFCTFPLDPLFSVVSSHTKLIIVSQNLVCKLSHDGLFIIFSSLFVEIIVLSQDSIQS
jgi:hypothetical protein